MRRARRVVLLGLLSILSLPAMAFETGATGGGQAHSNTQPVLAINHMIALSGLFPGSGTSGTILGEVAMFAGNFAPRGWAFADGQLLPVNQNQALFALLGTTYGGDGRTTFSLPDMRGRTAVHPGNGPGLSDWRLGQETGTDSLVLTEDQMPAHDHAYLSPAGVSDIVGAGLPHSNVMPSLALTHTIALSGVYQGSAEFVGEVSLFAGTRAPGGEALANGQLLPVAQNDALFSLLGTTYGGDGRTTFALPDLRGRTAVHPGAGQDGQRRLGERFGDETVVMSVGDLPSHVHDLPPSALSTESTGGSASHANVQPSLGLNYMIATEGLYPTRDGGTGDGTEPFLGQVGLFAGSRPPNGWMLANGQPLSVAQNSALFSLLGTTYGGDGRTTFSLPDLRDRTPIHPGSADLDMPRWRLGQQGGGEEIVLTVDQLPSHTHLIAGCDINADGVCDVNDIDAQTQRVLDAQATEADRTALVENQMPLGFNTYIGDSDLSSQFDASDIIAVLAAGKYRTGEFAGWASGDWDGNFLFDEQDLVAALAAGGYLQPAKPAVAAVPEPSSLLLWGWAVACLLTFCRRFRR